MRDFEPVPSHQAQAFAKFGSGAFAGNGHKRHKKHKFCDFCAFCGWTALFTRPHPILKRAEPQVCRQDGLPRREFRKKLSLFIQHGYTGKTGQSVPTAVRLGKHLFLLPDLWPIPLKPSPTPLWFARVCFRQALRGGQRLLTWLHCSQRTALRLTRC